MLNKLFNIISNPKTLSPDQIAQMLKLDKNALKEFENAYIAADFANGISDNLFQINSRQMSELHKLNESNCEAANDMVHRIVSELIAQTQVYEYNPVTKTSVINDYSHLLSDTKLVTKEEINTLPKEVQPQLTGHLMQTDIPDSGAALLMMYQKYKNEKSPKIAKDVYNHFRQGLDLLDIDNITYAMINTNPNSMGNWLPYVTDAIDTEGFFKIPATKIIKVPVTMLQLTRQDYMQLSRTTLNIVNEYCYNVFGLKDDGDYFIKTGTYSSKFDFRNARVNSEKEIHELGEYLLFNHWQALQMAHYDLSGRHQPIIYGVSTTVEWVVREFIPDCEKNLTIYHGLPLRTEYRAFVDFDTKQVIGIHPYWDPAVMEKNFAGRYETDIDARHDYITYMANKDALMARYDANKDAVVEHLSAVIKNINLNGQWSVDIMQNGDDFYLIDMAIAENSAFYDCVPIELRNPMTENWLPDLKGKE